MSNFVKTSGRIISISKVTYAVVYPDQTILFPVDYHAVTLVGEEAQRMNEALKAAGFVGDGTLINPERVSAIEDAGTMLKVYLEGADRIIHITPDQMSSLERAVAHVPMQESPAEQLVSASKPTRKKASEQ